MRTLIIILTTLLLTTPAFSLNEIILVGQYQGEDSDNYFGDATAMGDFDNDGLDEFIIGANGWNERRGKNYYYDWVGDWPVEAAWTFQGTTPSYSYDWYDHNIGDVNNDGIDDLGLVEMFPGVYGRFDILFGSDPFDSLADWSMEAGAVTNLGYSLDSLGDVNGDGGKDFIMGIWPEGTYATEKRIYFGGEVLDTIPDWRYTSVFSYGKFCGLGDVNTDEYNDVMLFDNELPVLLFFGGSTMDTIPDMIFDGHSNNDNAAIGDVNDDGYNDFSIRLIPAHDTTGRAIYFGGPDVDDIPDAYLLDEFGDPTWAPNFITHGDVNGDGISDIITGDSHSFYNRCAYVYLGSPWFNPVPDALIIGLDPIYYWGQEISVGDVNGDGCDEILISASNYWFETGVVFLYTCPDEWIDYGAGIEPGDLPHTPGWYTLGQNYPNPFNASTTIHFELGKASLISLTVYDLTGHTIKQLVKPKELIPGGYNVTWNGKNDQNQSVSSGIYLMVLQVDQYRETRKMVLMR
jgi:hypothetical protein